MQTFAPFVQAPGRCPHRIRNPNKSFPTDHSRAYCKRCHARRGSTLAIEKPFARIKIADTGQSRGWLGAASSVGRAPRSQRGGREFESRAVHHSFQKLGYQLVARRARWRASDSLCSFRRGPVAVSGRVKDQGRGDSAIRGRGFLIRYKPRCPLLSHRLQTKEYRNSPYCDWHRRSAD